MSTSATATLEPRSYDGKNDGAASAPLLVCGATPSDPFGRLAPTVNTKSDRPSPSMSPIAAPSGALPSASEAYGANPDSCCNRYVTLYDCALTTRMSVRPSPF